MVRVGYQILAGSSSMNYKYWLIPSLQYSALVEMGIAVTKVNVLNDLGTIAKCDAEAFREVV